jgi:hypothetical protein
MLNFDSCYPIKDEEKIKFLLWAKDMNISVIDPEAEQNKFKQITEYLYPNRFLTALKLIYPNLKSDIQKQIEIRENLQSLGFYEQILDKRFRRIITCLNAWPDV